jgi:hypothetical protein
MALGDSLFMNYISDDNFESTLFEIYNTILKRIKTPRLTLNRDGISSLSPLPRMNSMRLSNPSSRHNSISSSVVTSPLPPSTPSTWSNVPYDDNSVQGTPSDNGGSDKHVTFSDRKLGVSLTSSSASSSVKKTTEKEVEMHTAAVESDGGSRFGLSASSSDHSCVYSHFHCSGDLMIQDSPLHLHEKELANLSEENLQQLVLYLIGRNQISLEMSSLISQEGVTGEVLLYVESEDELVALNFFPNSLPKAKKSLLINRFLSYKSSGKVLLQADNNMLLEAIDGFYPLEALGVQHVNLLVMNMVGNPSSKEAKELTSVIFRENITGECLSFVQDETDLHELLISFFPASLPPPRKKMIVSNLMAFSVKGQVPSNKLVKKYDVVT